MKLFEIFKLLSEEQLFEDRIDYLKTNFTDKLDKKFQNDHSVSSDLKSEIQNHGFDNDGLNLIDYFMSIDPDKKKTMTQWIITKYLTGQMQLEDAYKLKEDLTLFLAIRNKLPTEQRDINRYKTINDLYSVIKDYKPEDAMSGKQQKKLVKDEMLSQATVVMNNNTYQVLIPNTHKAACHFGINTRWCTASQDRDSYYKQYSSFGPLYIILHKPSNTRWQFHLETASFMDEEDRPIDIKKFVTEHPLIDKLFKHIDEQNVIDTIKDVYVMKTKLSNYPSKDSIVGVFDVGLSRFVDKKQRYAFVIPVSSDKKIYDTKLMSSFVNSHREPFIKFLNEYGFHGGSYELCSDGIYFDEEKTVYTTFDKVAKPYIKYKSVEWVVAPYADDIEYRLIQTQGDLFGDAKYLLQVFTDTSGKKTEIVTNDIDIKQIEKYLVDLIIKTNINEIDPDEGIQLSEISSESLGKIISKKPTLGDINTVYKVFGDSVEFRDKVDQYFEDESIPTTEEWCNHGLIVENFSNINELVETVGDYSAKSYFNDEMDFDYYDPYVDDSVKERLLEHLSEEDKKRLIQHLIDEHNLTDDEDCDIDLNITEDTNLVDLILEIHDYVSDDDLDTCFSRAASYGTEHGSRVEAFNLIKQKIENSGFVFFGNNFKRSLEWDVPVHIVVSPLEIVERYNDDSLPSSYDDWSKMLFEINLGNEDVSGYDEDAAAEQFENEIYELVK